MGQTSKHYEVDFRFFYLPRPLLGRDRETPIYYLECEVEMTGVKRRVAQCQALL